MTSEQGKPGLHPYVDLPETAFWRSAVSSRDPMAINGLWVPRFPITPKDGVTTFGSCFAQHFGRSLRARGYRWLTPEAPPRKIPPALGKEYGYGQFSARTGNIYTPTLMLQWLRWAFGVEQMPKDHWPDGAGFRDPYRPRLEPSGFETVAELRRLRRVTLKAIRDSVLKAKVFVFTLGLTERWVDLETGLEYPLCPGTAAGTYDGTRHAFAPLDYPQALDAMAQALDLMRGRNEDLRFLLTVSPVALAATASGAHVLTATSASKAILRAVTASLADSRADTDYFPSFEIITSPVFGGRFLAADQRQVTREGVRFVMDSFFSDMAAQFPDTVASSRPGSHGSPRTAPPEVLTESSADDVVCEEELLAAFGPRP